MQIFISFVLLVCLIDWLFVFFLPFRGEWRLFQITVHHSLPVLHPARCATSVYIPVHYRSATAPCSYLLLVTWRTSDASSASGRHGTVACMCVSSGSTIHTRLKAATDSSRLKYVHTVSRSLLLADVSLLSRDGKGEGGGQSQKSFLK